QDCLRLWNNMAQRQLYITGGIGSQSSGEAFSSDYDLPNDTVYAESCASIGLMMFARRMLEMEADSRYADVMERALYNTVLGGMALDGKHFF
ncbi:glycoside hydrolase family 127 protein, partial [Escherichia coli]